MVLFRPSAAAAEPSTTPTSSSGERRSRHSAVAPRPRSRATRPAEVMYAGPEPSSRCTVTTPTGPDERRARRREGVASRPRSRTTRAAAVPEPRGQGTVTAPTQLSDMERVMRESAVDALTRTHGFSREVAMKAIDTYGTDVRRIVAWFHRFSAEISGMDYR